MSTDVFFLLSPTLFFLFIIYMVSPFSVIAVHAGIDGNDVYSSVKHKLCPKSHTSVSIPKCSTFLCSTLIVWCNNLDMGSAVPNQHCHFALSSIFERTLCTQNARYLAQKHVI